jgi:hypothetical protein
MITFHNSITGSPISFNDVDYIVNAAVGNVKAFSNPSGVITGFAGFEVLIQCGIDEVNHHVSIPHYCLVFLVFVFSLLVLGSFALLTLILHKAALAGKEHAQDNHITRLLLLAFFAHNRRIPRNA